MILRKGRLYNNEKGRRAFQPIMKKNLLSNIPSYKHIQLNSGCFRLRFMVLSYTADMMELCFRCKSFLNNF